MSREKYMNSILLLALAAGIIIYGGSIIWINFHGQQWYSFDIYSDTVVSKLMAEERTLFPESWVFGNQYYVVATPVLAAIIYGVFHNSILALALASTIMMFLILWSFAWSIKPFLGWRDMLVGEFCIIGTVMLGNNAAVGNAGLIYFYTMASFYACYVWGIIFTLGVFFRIKKDKRINSVSLFFCLVMAIALGMQSLRQTLVLYLPLLAITILMYLLKRGNIKCLAFSVLVLCGNLAGYVIIKYIPVHSAPIIGDIKWSANMAELIENWTDTTQEFLSITGLSFWQNGIKWIPLFAVAVCMCGVVLTAISMVIKKKDDSVLGCLILFSTVSLLAVYAVGVLLLRIRGIYFFVWYLLVTYSVMYMVKEIKNVKMKNLLICGLLCGGVLNYICNFVPDYIEYYERSQFYQQVTDDLIEEGIDCVYYDLRTWPLFAAFSKDKILAGTVALDPDNKSDGLMYPVPYLMYTDVFYNAKDYNSYMVFTNWTFDYLERDASESYRNKLMSELEYVKSVQYGEEEFYFYRFPVDILNVDYIRK